MSSHNVVAFFLSSFSPLPCRSCRLPCCVYLLALPSSVSIDAKQREENGVMLVLSCLSLVSHPRNYKWRWRLLPAAASLARKVLDAIFQQRQQKIAAAESH